MIMSYFIIFYTLSAIIPLAWFNYDIFVKKQTITYGEYFGMTCVFLTPVVNFVAGLMVLSFALSKSDLFDKAEKFFNKSIN